MWQLSHFQSHASFLLRTKHGGSKTIYSASVSIGIINIISRNKIASSNDILCHVSISSRSLHKVALQLDYYMSPQFAGIASSVVQGTYRDAGIDLSFLPICPVGMEQARVRAHQDGNTSDVTVGSVEQNIFVPTLAVDPSLRSTAVAAMFRRSPLCLASLQELPPSSATIGAHADTVSLLQRIFPRHQPVASPRPHKTHDLLSGRYNAIQAYTTTEVPALRRALNAAGRGDSLVVTPLEGRGLINEAKLGYGQVLFASNESLLLNDDRRAVTQAFLKATFDGWATAIRDPYAAVEMVHEAKKMLQLDDEGNDHWHESAEFELEMLHLCNDHVKETFEGDRYGVIDAVRWSEATKWLLEGSSCGSGPVDNANGMFGLDSTLWVPPSNLLAGSELARTTMEDAKASAFSFQETHGRKPSLAVITVGELTRYTQAERRLQLYSNKSQSWFSKTDAGAANGFDVQEINLAGSVTTEDILCQIYALKDMDGIQLMWPLPDHINSTKVYNAISLSKDVDGIHFVGQAEISTTVNAYPPVTPAGAMALIDKYNVDVRGKRVLVVGRSLIVGSPLAHMLRSQGAVVTVAHSTTSQDQLESLVGETDVLVNCAGLPKLIQADWVKGAEVINIGSTFVEETYSLHSDVEGDLGPHASRYSPVPGGTGPLSNSMLFQNVAKAAWDRMNNNGAIERTWNLKPASITKVFHFDDYTSALEFGKAVNEMSTVMDHHANMKTTHQCVNGVDVEMEFFTFEAGFLTEKDYDAAKAVDMVYSGNQIRMSDFTYDLQEGSIAKYPASPRGSSKLLEVDGNGRVSYHGNFSAVFPSLAEGAHLVFNDSRVMDARLFAKAPHGSRVEVMVLDLGKVDIGCRCIETILHVMIRSGSVNVGDVFIDASSGSINFEVVSVEGIWEEDDKSEGNGMECDIRINSQMSVEDFLNVSGSVPIPPYFQREAEASDEEAYNNVYATKEGSVAAPTAGLHFTPAILDEIGGDNCTYISLHVGAGTFKPVMVDDARDHEMHAEAYSVSVGEIRRIIKAIESGKQIIVVGTTSSRTLESMFWCGVKRIRGMHYDPSNLTLHQFEWIPLAVGDGKHISSAIALKSLVDGMEDSDVLRGTTSLMITPTSYDFKVVDHLLTNFHAPDSTLMLLVSAFVESGDKIKRVYEDAQKQGYRFLSYGDVCLFSRPTS